jgi:hypothetical protein
MTTTKVRLADGQDIPLRMPAKRVIAQLAEPKDGRSLIRFPAANGIPVWINPQYVAAVWQMPEIAGAPEAESEVDAATNGHAYPEPVAS